MKIIGIGVDIVETARIEQSVARHGDRFLDRLFTQEERRYCDGMSVPARCYAARFAAKEAVLKALKTGWTGGVAWQDVEIVSLETGAPVLVFRGRVRRLYEQTGAAAAHLSISHTSEHAIAQVILER